MRLLDVVKTLPDENACYEFLINSRWPNGPCCIHCGSVRISRFNSTRKSGTVRRLFQCLEKECNKQFSPLVGTIFSDTKLPLKTWLMAVALIVHAKKGISSMQVQRHLGLKSYRTAWHLTHRIRRAMVEDGDQLSGVTEIDETYVGPRTIRKGDRRKPRKEKAVVLGMLERGGRVRLIHIADATRSSIQPALEKHVSPWVSKVYTGEHSTYPFALKNRFPGKHVAINHSLTYGKGADTTNHIENVFSLFKRGLLGSFHRVSYKHLSRYCHEFSFRFNRRENETGIFSETVKSMANTKPMMYRKLISEWPPIQAAL
jgi:transposase-like protein